MVSWLYPLPNRFVKIAGLNIEVFSVEDLRGTNLEYYHTFERGKKVVWRVHLIPTWGYAVSFIRKGNFFYYCPECKGYFE
jgi:hypothetical protein